MTLLNPVSLFKASEVNGSMPLMSLRLLEPQNLVATVSYTYSPNVNSIGSEADLAPVLIPQPPAKSNANPNRDVISSCWGLINWWADLWKSLAPK